jgi:hypothetical protein
VRDEWGLSLVLLYNSVVPVAADQLSLNSLVPTPELRQKILLAL